MTLEARVLGQAVAVGLAIIALSGLVRRPSRETLDVSLFLVGFATTLFFDINAPLVPTFVVVALGATAEPYLLVRITDHFRPVPRWFERAMLAGLVYCWILNLSMLAFVFRFEGTPATNPPPPALLGALQTIYLLAGLVYVARVFVSGAFAASGMRRARLRLAAAASIMVFVAIAAITAATYATVDDLGRSRQPRLVLDLFYLMVAAAGVMYFAAFAPPPWLRQLWRLGELHRYLEASVASSIGERRREALDALLGAAMRATGAVGGAAALAGPSGELVVGAAEPSDGDAKVRQDLAQAWRERRAVVTRDSIAVPIQTRDRDLGALAVTFRRRPLFAEDDVAVLGLMADRAAVAFANAELFREQRLLAERTHALEEQERRRVQEELDRVDAELRIARDIQHSLLPTAAPEIGGWRIASHYQPARTVGGDFYDYFDLPDGSLALVAGDASGKGIPAALLMATTRSVLRAASARSSSPGRILTEVNGVLCRAMPPSMFVTCLIVSVDPRTGSARYANAGHLPAYSRDGHSVVQLRARGMPLGLMSESEYEERGAEIGRGGTLLLYSDGVVEAHDAKGRLFGFDRLRDLFARSGGDPIAAVLDDLRAFTTGEAEQEDDITLLTVERTA